jgi:hypothetical protein
MIHYQLRCGADHRFDGWFPNSAAFDGQAARGLLSCPICGSTGVTRALMAPAVGKRRKAPAQVAVPDAPATAPSQPVTDGAPIAVGALPDQVRAMLQKMRAEVEKRCDYVGDTFASEARKMHEGETEARPIYGEATPEQAQRLADDGIEVAQIPWVARADS